MKKPNEKGSIYTLTLASSLVLVALVLGISYQILQFRRTSRANTQTDQATVYAELGIRHALHYTSVDTNWRQNLTSGPWLTDIAVGDALYSVEGIDPVDDDLANNDTDPVELTCTAVVGGVTRTVQVYTRQEPCELLKYAVAAGGDLLINNAGHIRIYGDATSNQNIVKTGADTRIFGNAEAVGTIGQTNNITGTISPGSAAKTFPDPVKVFSYYNTRAKAIPYQPLIEKILLSPTDNPFGAPDPDGLYKINCADQTIVIKNCRIVGTLLLINPKNDSRIEVSINWQPARPDYPALLIDGTQFTIITDRDLDEDQINEDLNLPGEPGFGDIDEIFPNEINGLVYCKGSLLLDKDTVIKGAVIVTEAADLRDNADCTAELALYSNPPIGFRCEHLVPVPGTWRQVLPPAN